MTRMRQDRHVKDYAGKSAEGLMTVTSGFYPEMENAVR